MNVYAQCVCVCVCAMVCVCVCVHLIKHEINNGELSQPTKRECNAISHQYIAPKHLS